MVAVHQYRRWLLCEQQSLVSVFAVTPKAFTLALESSVAAGSMS